MWIGQTAYLELADGAVPDYNGGTTHMHAGQGYLAVDEIRMSDRPRPADDGIGRDPEPIDLRRLVARSALPTRARRSDRRRRANAIDRPSPRSPSRRLALAIADGTAMDEHVNIRGNPRSRASWSLAASSRCWAASGCPRPRRAAAGSSWPDRWSTPRPTR